MEWSNLLSPVLAILGGLLGSYLVMRQNRPLIAAQVDEAVARAGSSRATTRQTDVDTAADLIALQKSSFELRVATLEANQAAKDLVQATVVAGLNSRIDALLLLGTESKACTDKLLLESIENNKLLAAAQATIEAMRREVIALREQLLGLGEKPSPEASSAAADVKATEGQANGTAGETVVKTD